MEPKTPAEWLRANLELSFSLPPAAVEYLMGLWNAMQVFDDMADGDPILRCDLNSALWDLLVALPTNPFYLQHAHQLIPALSVAILKWHGANHAESDGAADARSFLWRAGYYDIVLLVVSLVHGHEYASENACGVMRLYGESFNDYLDEFKCPHQQ